MRLAGKVALITGSGSGIGRATAILFAREGAKVAVNSKSNSGQEVVKEIVKIGGQAIFVQGRVEDPSVAERLVTETVKAFGRLDVLFNNAALLVPGSVDSISLEDWEQSMAVNVRGIFLVSKFAIMQMRKQGGGVIISTMGGGPPNKGLKNRAAYSASKGAVWALTKAMAADYASENIRVNCVCPGAVDTPFLHERLRELGGLEAGRKAIAAQTPLGRIGKPEDIAAGVLYLASDEAAFVTGAALTIDGGSSFK